MVVEPSQAASLALVSSAYAVPVNKMLAPVKFVQQVILLFPPSEALEVMISVDAASQPEFVTVTKLTDSVP